MSATRLAGGMLATPQKAMERHDLTPPGVGRVTTAAGVAGRVAQGAPIELAVAAWYRRRRFEAVQFPAARLRVMAGAAGDRRPSVAVIIPTKECAATIVGVLRDAVEPVQALGLVDEVIVVDADSADGTAALAANAGADVVAQDEIRPDLGRALGKGDAMWRALQVTTSDIVCFLDGDTADPAPAHLQGLLGPLLSDPTVELVKGTFDRPLRNGELSLPNEGGRVTELMARPLINLHEPLLAGFSQPLAGEFAARRELFEAVSFPVGYGVEIAVLIDALRLVGLDGLAECHLGSRQNRHQPLRALGEMAYAVLAAVERRRPAGPVQALAAGRYLKPWEQATVAAIPVAERPPIGAERAARRSVS